MTVNLEDANRLNLKANAFHFPDWSGDKRKNKSVQNSIENKNKNIF